MATITNIHSGLAGCIGCDYIGSSNSLVFVEYGGKVSRIDLNTNAYSVLGTGYTNPEDIQVTPDGLYAYVTERSGDLVRVDLANANRSHATVITSGMTAPQQIALDHDRHHAYVVEYASAGNLYRINLDTGSRVVVASGLVNAVGIVVKADDSFAYITEQTGGGRITRVSLTTGLRTVMVTGFTAPFFLRFTDNTESAVYVVERDPANRISRVDFASLPIVPHVAVTGLPARPSSLAFRSAFDIVVCSDSAISNVDLSPYLATGPLVLGIGAVPFNLIDPSTGLTLLASGFNGSPFGAGIDIMFNHTAARTAGAAYYQIKVGAAVQSHGFSDWKLVGTAFVDTPVNPVTIGGTSGLYPVHAAADVWYTAWLGYRLDTTAFTTGAHIVSAQLFDSAGHPIAVAPGTLKFFIDNGLPSVHLEKILKSDGVTQWPACATCNVDGLRFQITAFHPRNMYIWNLVALWGVDKSAGVASGETNIVSSVVPPLGTPPAPAWSAVVAGDPSSHACGHTFILSAWDRVINGYSHIHYDDSHQTIDIRF
jgi:hypothetical protein